LHYGICLSAGTLRRTPERTREIAMQQGAAVLVTGAGGFIGHHLTKYLVQRGYKVRGADIKYPEFEATNADEFVIADLRNSTECQKVTRDIDDVYHLAADMGGIGYISTSHAAYPSTTH
jgi:GDP-D-mannose 3', 5'-epimerase